MAPTAEQVTAEPGLGGTGCTLCGWRILVQPHLRAGVLHGALGPCVLAGGSTGTRGPRCHSEMPRVLSQMPLCDAQSPLPSGKPRSEALLTPNGHKLCGRLCVTMCVGLWTVGLCFQQ